MNVRQPPSKIFQRLATSDFKTQCIDGNDVQKVYETLKEVVARIRQTKMPQFVECMTYRVREHVGPLFDYERGYRSQQEVEAWIAQCPIKRFTEQLIKNGVMTAAEIETVSSKWAKLSGDAYTAALKSPWPDEDQLLKSVY